jgi:phosphoglycerol transferase MdoB-like AlkP superfamily enzyme
MWGGLRFDLTALLYLNLLYIILYLLPFPFTSKRIYRQFIHYLFLTTNALGIAINLIDVFYFDYILKRSTVEMLMFASESNIGSLFIEFMKDFWYGFILFAFLMYAINKWYKYIKDIRFEVKFTIINFITGLSILLLSLYLSVVGIRGGFTRTTRPININNAGAYVQKPLEMAIVLNSTFTFIRTLKKQAFKPVHYFNKEDLASIYTPEKHFESDSLMQRKNIMIIIVESLAKEYTGLLNKDIKNYKGFTPFLDSLMLQSHTFTNAYANGRKSIDAMPSILASIPSLVQPYVLSPYSTNKINGIGSLLKKKGYKSAFFHGAPNGSMGFDAFANLAGFDAYYGMTEYGKNNDNDGPWGIPDDKFLQYTAQVLDTFKKPFVSALFTLSSHHPFTLPEGFEGKFNGGELPIHKVIQYTDYSLKHFFQVVSTKEWYQNTIFVITADHCNQSYLPEYRSTLGRHAVPIIFFDPSQTDNAKLDNTPTQQIDIIPRLLRKLNYSGDFISFGNDPDNSKSPFVINYTGNTWEFMQNDYLLRFRKDKPISLYNYKEDRLLRKSIMSKHKKITSEMTKQLKAFIQQYKNRLIQNRLTINN